MNSQDSSFLSRCYNWLRQHKIISGITGVVVVIVIVALASGIFSSMTASPGSGTAFDAPVADYQRSGNAGGQPTTESASDADIPGVEIKKGSLSVDSENAKADEKAVRSITSEYNGYVEEGRQSKSNTRLRINLTTRVPAESFSGYVEGLRDRLEVEDYQLRDYRINISEQTTRLDILNDTLDIYDRMKQEVQSMDLDDERIELTRDITERQLELKERLNRIQSEVDRVNRQGEMATLQVTLEERLSAEIWPNDTGNEFRDELSDTFDRIVDIAIAIVTTTLVVLMTTIQWAIWIIISLLVVWFAYRLLRRLYGSWYE